MIKSKKNKHCQISGSAFLWLLYIQITRIMENIKKFESASAADNYAIVDIPFMTSVATNPIQNLVCNETGKKLVSVGGEIEVQSAGPEMVDLGLSVKWTKYNVGAVPSSTPQSYYGGYYSWGETETKSNYIWRTYKYCTPDYNPDEGEGSLTKYTGLDSKTVLETIDDAATQAYGNDYRIPTETELKELLSLSNEWVTNYNGISGLNGRVFTGKNGNTLFIPAAGAILDGSSSEYTGSDIFLWSSSLDPNGPDGAWGLNLDSGGFMYIIEYRCLGFSVRAVKSLVKV